MRLAIALLLSLSRPALAHDFTPGVLALEEIEPHRFRFRFTPPVDSGSALSVEVRFSEGCTVRDAELDCRPKGLRSIAFSGLAKSQAVILIRWADGRTHESIATSADPIAIEGRPSPLGWLWIGAEHVLLGLDHLAFLIGLLLVTGFSRRIVLTVTAFTLAHSLTLALSALDLLRLPSTPVEATIAASVLLVARESTHDQPTLTRRFPWAVALLFGLVHGLGFAGALEEIGLPRDSIGTALLLFNAGVELGGLAVVALALIAAHLARPIAGRRTSLAIAYALGTLGAYWLLTRCTLLFDV